MATLNISSNSVQVNGITFDASAPFVNARSVFSQLMMPVYREREKYLYQLLNQAREEANAAIIDMQTSLVSPSNIPASYKSTLQSYVSIGKSNISTIKDACTYYGISTTLHDNADYAWTTQVEPELSTPLSDQVNDATAAVGLVVSTISNLISTRVALLVSLANKINGAGDGVGVLITDISIAGATYVASVDGSVVRSGQYQRPSVVARTYSYAENLGDRAQDRLTSCDYILESVGQPLLTTEERNSYLAAVADADAERLAEIANTIEVKVYDEFGDTPWREVNADGTTSIAMVGSIPDEPIMAADSYHYYDIHDVTAFIGKYNALAMDSVGLCENYFGRTVIDPSAADNTYFGGPVGEVNPPDLESRLYEGMLFEFYGMVFPSGLLTASDKPRAKEIFDSLIARGNEVLALNYSTELFTHIQDLQNHKTTADLDNPVDTVVSLTYDSNNVTDPQSPYCEVIGTAPNNKDELIVLCISLDWPDPLLMLMVNIVASLHTNMVNISPVAPITDSTETIVIASTALTEVFDQPMQLPTAAEQPQLSALFNIYNINHQSYLDLISNIALYTAGKEAAASGNEMEFSLNRSATWYCGVNGNANSEENNAFNASLTVNTPTGDVTLNNPFYTPPASGVVSGYIGLMDTYTGTLVNNSMVLE